MGIAFLMVNAAQRNKTCHTIPTQCFWLHPLKYAQTRHKSRGQEHTCTHALGGGTTHTLPPFIRPLVWNLRVSPIFWAACDIFLQQSTSVAFGPTSDEWVHAGWTVLTRRCKIQGKIQSWPTRSHKGSPPPPFCRTRVFTLKPPRRGRLVALSE